MSDIGDKIYDIIVKFMPGAYWLARATPDYSTEDRITSLWLWAMENYHKYDPAKGTLEQWLKGMSRRVIDAYRKDQNSRYYYVGQYPEWTDERGETMDYASNAIADHREKPINYDVDRYALVCKALDLLSDDTKCILTEVAKKDPKRNVNKKIEEGLADSLGISKVSMQSRRTLAKNTIRTFVTDLEHNIEDYENGNGYFSS